MSAVVLAVTAGACSTSDEIDTGSLENEIQSGLEAETGVAPESVECPDGIEIEEGRELECTALADGTDATVEVRLTDEEGGFEFNVPAEQFE